MDTLNYLAAASLVNAPIWVRILAYLVAAAACLGIFIVFILPGIYDFLCRDNKTYEKEQESDDEFARCFRELKQERESKKSANKHQ